MADLSQAADVVAKLRAYGGDDHHDYRHRAADLIEALLADLRSRAHNPQASSAGLTEAQAAYGLLWHMRTDDKRIHEARRALFAQIGKEGQRAGLEWALRTFGPHNEPALEELP